MSITQGAATAIFAGVLACIFTPWRTPELRAQNSPQESALPEGDATNQPPPPPPVPPHEASVLTNMVFRPLGGGVFELGKLRFSKPERSIRFPAFVNSAGGPLEYFLVTSYGKTHESALRTEAEPMHLQLALLLLDAKGDPGAMGGPSSGSGTASPARTPVANPNELVLKGDPVQLEVSWTVDGKSTKCAAEQLVFNQLSQKSPTAGNWVYNGSLVMDGMFFAQRDGSIISLITDQLALINNVGSGHDNDDIWTINTNRVPAMNTPVEITIRLTSAPSAK